MKNIKFSLAMILLTLIVVAGLVVFLKHSFNTTKITPTVEESVNPTPISVESMRMIGEWEFLNISDEEIVDTTRKRLFSDDHLSRIYYGELRLGIDMKKLGDDAVKTEGDSVIIKLPEIVLLDDNFIDEARSKTFYESGKWNPQSREALYKKAKQKMKKRCLTKENKEKARQNAIHQVTKMAVSFGMKNVVVR